MALVRSATIAFARTLLMLDCVGGPTLPPLGNPSCLPAHIWIEAAMPATSDALVHDHVFLGESHDKSASKTWTVIWICGAMMILEIAGGLFFGSIALVADGLHMSTHAGALLLAALAYTYARKHETNDAFTFGSGKFGDLAGFTSAIILAMIALLIGYESISRIFQPVAIHFSEAIPIAFLGLSVNVVSAVLLSSGGGHNHGHSHGNSSNDEDHDEARHIATSRGALTLEVFEDGVPPRFRICGAAGVQISVETERSDGARQSFALIDLGDYLESVDEVPEPHQFVAHVRVGDESQSVQFEEHAHAHGSAHRDNNMRAAVIHVFADAAVSVLVIVGLLLARAFGWLWMDPLAGIVGACVIASWSYGLVRDTGAILLDMNPDRRMEGNIRAAIETGGDRLVDLHLWRLGPGHLGAILAVVTDKTRNAVYYRSLLTRFKTLSHITIEVLPARV